MQAARPDEIKEEIETTLGIDPSEVLAVSGKTGLGVPEIFRAIIGASLIRLATSRRRSGA